MNRNEAKKIRRPSRVAMVLMCILLALVLLINVAVIGIIQGFNLYNIANGFFGGGQFNTPEARAASQDAAHITELVEEEAIVLLKNTGTLPIAEGSKINLFGYANLDVAYGGSGSGSVSTTNNIDLVQGLQNAGFELNPNLMDFYSKHRTSRDSSGFEGNDYSVYEVARSEFSDELLQGARDYSDVAVVTIARVGGEGGDLPLDMAGYIGGDSGKHYLELQQVEIDLLNMVEEKFDTVIVLINSSHALELGFLEDAAVDAALWIGSPGSAGSNAVGSVLKGAVNPSGRLPDTYVYDVTTAPSYYNFGDYQYTNGPAFVDFFGAESQAHYVEYVEGIYVGYRFYETRFVDNSTGQCDELAYGMTVQYPFGYGLSYTEFTQKISNFRDDGMNITMDVTVKNIGNTAGKDVVQVYYTAPYHIGGIEKSHVVLADFAKTGVIDPGQSETVTLSFTYESMASYDYTGIKAQGGAYVLEAGEYEIKLQSNAHNVIDSRTITVGKDYIYNDANNGARATDLTIATNQFDDVSFGQIQQYASRADWEGTLPTQRAPSTKEASADTVATLSNDTYFNDDNEADIIVAKNGLKLSDLEGVPYDDEKWDLLLQQLSVDDMYNLIENGGWSSAEIKSIDKPYLVETDGPAGIHNFVTGMNGNQYTSETTMGATWNVGIVRKMGEVFGAEAVAYHVSGLYAPGMNIHRSPFAGRNFEYFSEDGLLSGKLASAEVEGIQSNGVFCYSKHFVLNDQETNRQGVICTWANEQAIRELYMKPFELAVKEGRTMGIMSSYNLIGATWTGGSYPLLTTVLRNEWGFVGCVVSDCAMGLAYMDMNAGVRAGNDLDLSFAVVGTLNKSTTDTVTGRQAMRRACHNILYMDVNSGAFSIAKQPTPYWMYAAVVIDVVIFGLIALYFVKRHNKMKAWKAANSDK